MLSAVVHRHPLSGHEGVNALLGDAREVTAVIEVLDLIEMMVVIEMMIEMMMMMMMRRRRRRIEMMMIIMKR